MQSQSNAPDDSSQYQCTCRRHWPSFQRPLLTRSTGNAFGQYPVGYQDLRSRYEASQPIGYLVPYGDHWLLTQPYILPEGRNIFPPGIGRNVDLVVPAGYDEASHSWPGSEDPGSFSRCGIDPGVPIHLTTNIRVVLPHVSYLCLSEEVCRYSVWRAH